MPPRLFHATKTDKEPGSLQVRWIIELVIDVLQADHARRRVAELPLLVLAPYPAA